MPAEIDSLRAEMRSFAQGYVSTGEWLSSAMDAGWEMAKGFLDVPELADLLAERHRIITTDWQTAFSACELLDHAADLAAQSAALVHENDRRWRIFHDRVQTIAGV